MIIVEKEIIKDWNVVVEIPLFRGNSNRPVLHQKIDKVKKCKFPLYHKNP